ncbi:MAG: hypothetical protein NEA02_09105 [Thermoanaerobaculia bacterium]|nr:hypothetical protein [Thermoanaerobaculia bacterium]
MPDEADSQRAKERARRRRRTGRKPAARTPAPASFEEEFGPGRREEPAPAAKERGGPIPGLACAGEGCVFKPAADLVGRFSLRLARGHGSTLSRAATSGIEFMKALRDFLDEEIVLAERAAGGGARPRYEKIEVE